MTTLTTRLSALGAGALLLTLAACGSDDGEPEDTASPTADAAPTATEEAPAELISVSVGASPVPHALILEFVAENLAADAGIELEIVEFDDYVLPNEALASGEIDANYFQHLPYLEAQIAEKGFGFTPGSGVHIEPYAAFSSEFDSFEDVPDGASIAITNDASNQIRGLRILEDAGALVDIGDDASVLTLTDEQNPRGFVFIENQPEVIVQQLDDPAVDVAFVNGNFILAAGLSTVDAIAVESVDDNPYANFLVWNTDNTDDAVAILDGLLHSPEVSQFIQETWPSGDVIPAF